MLAKEIMNKFVVKMKSIDSIKKAAEQMKNEGVGIVCVCSDSGVPIGVLTDRDIVLRACAQDLSASATTIASVMTPDPVTCGLDAKMDAVEHEMEKSGVGRVLVVDNAGLLAGIITLAEIWHSESTMTAGAMSRRLSERELRVEATGGHFDAARETLDDPSQTD